MRIGGGRCRKTWRNSGSVPLYPPQIPYHLTSGRTRAVAMGSRVLALWAMALLLRSSFSWWGYVSFKWWTRRIVNGICGRIN
jgi:hypothetical protein